MRRCVSCRFSGRKSPMYFNVSAPNGKVCTASWASTWRVSSAASSTSRLISARQAGQVTFIAPPPRPAPGRAAAA